MPEDFLSQLTSSIEENASNEQFGVSELANVMSMSRSNLLRKVKKQTGLSASQYIRKVRLEIAMEMLKDTSFSISEISYKVGFGSTSYFIKCFREQYGYPPGEIGKRKGEPVDINQTGHRSTTFNRVIISGILLVAVILLAVYLWPAREVNTEDPEKSIAVLPFKNESSDSTNVYFINGIMESTLNNLQKIEDLRVISRTSVEKYRFSEKAIPEIAAELQVNYFVEGSGQRVGDQVLLNIQLIDAASDRHIWAEQYNYQVVDLFNLQNEVAKKIADAIEAVVTPAELQQIEKIPTESLEAYDYYLRGLEAFHTRTGDGLKKAIPLFEKAIEQDPQFALAYANIAISYYFLDIYRTEKQYAEQLNNYADKALLYDSKLAESLIAKAFYYMQAEEFELAVPHLEKALEYNPNSSAVIQTLSDLYARYIPNTAKYLEYALKGIKLDIAANDSIQRSYIYLHLSNAFIQSGFVDEAITYINRSLDFNPKNEYAYIKAFITYARDRDLEQTKKELIRDWKRDTTRLDILQEVAKVFYYEEAYDSAFYYYKKFVHLRSLYGMDIFKNEDIKIAFVYRKMGLNEEANRFYRSYADFCEENQSIYKSILVTSKYVYEGEKEEAMKHLKLFAQQDNYQYWILLFLEMDPLIKPLQTHPDYHGLIQQIKERFWNNQTKLKNSLHKKGLI